MKFFRPSPPEISVIIPVLNEGPQLRLLLAHLTLAAAGVTYEVIIVDGDPNGSTLAQLPAGLSQVRTLISPPGRGRQMNRGAAQAQAPILLFLHADTRLPAQAFLKIQTLLQDPRWVGGAFDLGIDSRRWSLRLIGRLASWRSRLTRIPYGDQAIFVRASYFRDLGGYPNIPIMEDVALMRAIRQRGDRIQLLSDPVLTSPRRWEQEGLLYCTLRNWLLLSLYSLGASPQLLVRWYAPPKVSLRSGSRSAQRHPANPQRGYLAAADAELERLRTGGVAQPRR